MVGAEVKRVFAMGFCAGLGIARDLRFRRPEVSKSSAIRNKAGVVSQQNIRRLLDDPC
jgi:hypothetical protein